MGLLAKKGGGDEEKDPSGMSLDLERRFCPTCERELPPWRDTCPDDGATAVPVHELPSSDGPPIPQHLLDADDE